MDVRVRVPRGAGPERAALPRAPLTLDAAARRAALERAKARLDTLELYPTPVRIEGVRVLVAPWLFKLPRFRRFDGFTAWNLIFVRNERVGDGLITHELCHSWQMQHRPFAMPLSYLRHGYVRNPYEVEARAAVDRTEA